MTGRDLLEGMSFVEEEFISESQTPLPHRKAWKQILTAAACVCILMLSIYSWNTHMADFSGMESVVPNDANGEGGQSPYPGDGHLPEMGCTDPIFYCIRLNPVRGAFEDPAVIHSSEELRSYCQSIDAQDTDMFGSESEKIFDRYDDAYFESKDLLLFIRQERWKIDGYEIRSIRPDQTGGWIVTGNVLNAEETEDLSQWMIFVEVEKGMVADGAPIAMEFLVEKEDA